MSSSKENKRRPSTLAALLEERPKRGRPPRAVSRQNVYVSLTDEQKDSMSRLAQALPDGLVRADLPDLAISIVTARLEALRHAVAGRNREIPEGVTDLESVYLLWDLPLPPREAAQRWTSIRVSPQQAIELGRAHGTFNAAFGATRSQTFALALALLEQFLQNDGPFDPPVTLNDLRRRIADNYL